ncbi:MAG: ABC transporter substrate-binding protein [Chloroflexota bacterium]|nr:MAG: ABC transporter substrate-binding protein [Chloroflexota bacterium]
MKKRNLLWRILVTVGLFAVVIASGCAQETKSTPSASPSAAPASQSAAAASTKATPKTVGTEVKIGFITTAGGPTADLAPRARLAVDMALKEVNAAGGINGVPVKIVEAEGRNDPQEETKVLQRFASDDKVLAVLGSVSAEPAMVYPLVAKLKLPLITSSAAPSDILKASAPYGFTFLLPSTDMARASIKQAINTHKSKKLSSIYVGDLPNGRTFGEQTMQVAKELGLEVLDPITIGARDTDFTAAVTRLKGQIASQGADLVSIGHAGERVGVIVAEMRKQGIQIPVLAAYSAVTQGMINSGGQAVEGVIGATSWADDNSDPLQAKFVKEFEARAQTESPKNTKADYSSAYQYDVVRLLAKVMQDAGVSNAPENLAKDRELVAKGLLSVKDFSGVGGKISIGENGQVIREVFTIIVKDGKFKLLNRCLPSNC